MLTHGVRSTGPPDDFPGVGGRGRMDTNDEINKQPAVMRNALAAVYFLVVYKENNNWRKLKLKEYSGMRYSWHI